MKQPVATLGVEQRTLMLRRLFVFAVAAFVCLLLTALLAGFVMGDPPTTQRVRLATLLQDVLAFITPALIMAMMTSRTPADQLALRRGPGLTSTCLAIAVLFVAMPAMNWIIAWNASMQLPGSLAPLQQWMASKEALAAAQTKLLLGAPTAGDLVVDLLIVALFAGLSEEIFFRGALQRILGAGGRRGVVAVWLAAFLFSAFHMQFFGFVPRLLLGAYFGFLLLWSGSLWLPVIVHAVNNAMVVIATWMAMRGGGAGQALDTFGADNPVLIVVSVVLTAGCLFLLHKISRQK